MDNFIMNKYRTYIFNFLIIFGFGLIPALICQYFVKAPIDRYIHIRSFRYGKDPSVIRCNRGDTLHLTFSTDDTGHSFFLEEFDIDAKISPAREKVEVFKTSDPTRKSYLTKEVTFTAKHPGILNYLVAKSNYRCHVWCGPMHAFELGKLVIFPNTLLVFSLGCLVGILFLWIFGLFKANLTVLIEDDKNAVYKDLFLKWPARLQNDWLKLIVFLVLATFSTTLVADPKVSGITVLMLILIPTLMSLFWEFRSFCRYICPVSAFVGPFSRMSKLALRSKSQQVCDRCKPHYCQKGSPEGWACPYGLNVGEMKENSDCGLCLECTRSCLYNNVTLYRRPFGSELGTRNMSEAWLTMSVFTLSIVYSVLYEGQWPVVRDFVNILDKQNWDLFGIYTIIVWTLSLVIIPGIVYLLSYTGAKFSKTQHS